MKSLGIELKNCHGIRELDASFKFNTGSAAAVYAPNGTMKTSFARTLADLAGGSRPETACFQNAKRCGALLTTTEPS